MQVLSYQLKIKHTAQIWNYPRTAWLDLNAWLDWIPMASVWCLSELQAIMILHEIRMSGHVRLACMVSYCMFLCKRSLKLQNALLVLYFYLCMCCYNYYIHARKFLYCMKIYHTKIAFLKIFDHKNCPDYDMCFCILSVVWSIAATKH